jgi:hypothetical protein
MLLRCASLPQARTSSCRRRRAGACATAHTCRSGRPRPASSCSSRAAVAPRLALPAPPPQYPETPCALLFSCESCCLWAGGAVRALRQHRGGCMLHVVRMCIQPMCPLACVRACVRVPAHAWCACAHACADVCMRVRVCTLQCAGRGVRQHRCDALPRRRRLCRVCHHTRELPAPYDIHAQVHTPARLHTARTYSAPPKHAGLDGARLCLHIGSGCIGSSIPPE